MNSALAEQMNSKTPAGDPVESIAIVSMVCRFPGAANVDDFWANVRDGVESVTHFTKEELIAVGHDADLISNPDYVRAKGIVAGVDLFDAFFFGIPPREAEAMDPQHRLFLECAWEALEQAGYDGSRYPGQIGVFAGVGPNTYLLHHLLAAAEHGTLSDVFQMSIGNDKDFVPTRVSYQLNLTGPSINVNTGCSSALVATSLAVQSLLTYQCDMALAGGVALSFPHKTGYLYQPGMIASPDGHCRAFDAQAQGAVGADGLGIVLLKRTEDALADGDTIHAVIRGCAINNDGANKVGYTAPGVEGQSRVIAEAIAMAQVPPSTISYVETHGSGTALGDPIEVGALNLAFQSGVESSANLAANSCAIGSVKTNIGHTDAAAGIAGLIKTVQAIKHCQLPPSLHFTQPNPQIDFANTPFFVNDTLKPWPASAAPRRAGVSSFGIGGTNAHVVLEEAPPRAASSPSRAYHLLPISAKTPTALAAAVENLKAYLQANPDTNLADVAFTLSNRRAFSHRRAVVALDPADAARQLALIETEANNRSYHGHSASRVAFVFSPQDLARITLGRSLYESEASFQQAMDRCASLFKQHLNLNLLEELYAAEATNGNSQIAYAARFAAEYALAQLWLDWGIEPVAVFGQGPGEYVAACLAGVFSVEDAVALAAAQLTISASTDSKRRPAQPQPRLQAPTIPLISGASGTWISNSDATNPDYWLRHREQTNRFTEGLTTLGMTADILLEVDANVTLAAAVSTLGTLWQQGVDISWDSYYSKEQRHRIPLPTYPFERKSYLVHPRPLSNSSRTTAKPRPIEEWFYVPSWKLAPLPTQALHGRETWLLFTDDLGLGDNLAAQLRQAQQTVITVRRGEAFAQLSETAFSLNPSAPQDYVLLWQILTESTPRKIIHLWNVTNGSGATQIDSFFSLLYIGQAIGTRTPSSFLELFVIANSLHKVLDEDDLQPGKSLLLGPARVLPQEVPNLRCLVIDVQWRAREEVAAQLLNEVSCSSEEIQLAAQSIAYRGKRRWAACVEPVHLPASPGPIRNHGVYLITDGLSDMGLALAQALAPWQVKLALLCVTALPLPGEWQTWLATQPASDPLSCKIRILQHLQARGAEIFTLPFNPDHSNAVQQAVTQVIAKLGTLHGVIQSHSGNAEIGQTEALLNACRDMPLDFIVLSSSHEAFLGTSGVATHAAESAFQDAVAQCDPHFATLSIVWDSAPKLQRQSETTSEDVGNAFLRLLGAGLPRVIVSAYDLKKIMENPQTAQLLQDPKSVSSRAERQSRPEIGVEYQPVEPGVEEWLAEVWQTHLGMEPIGRNDDFFKDLGGQSLSAIALMNRIQEGLGTILQLRVIFAASTIAQMAAYLNANHFDSLRQWGLAQTRLDESSLAMAPNLLAASQPTAAMDPSALIARIDQLSEVELDAALAAMLAE